MGKKAKTLAWLSSDVVRSLVALVVVFLTLKFWEKLNNKPAANVLEQAHFDWLLSHGGVANVEIGKACASCPRGLIAKRDLQPASLILRIPEPALIKFPYIEDAVCAAEYARDLVHRMYTDPSFNATYAPYLAVLPTASELFTPEMWQQDHSTMLQTPALEALAEYTRRSTEEIYYGNFSENHYKSVSELLGGGNDVDLNTFKWASAVIASRYVAASLEEDSEIQTRMLAPLNDFANHADEGHNSDDENAYQTVFNGAVQLRAKRPIVKGEEIKFNYHPGVVHRPDMSLLAFGFFQKTKKVPAAPLLCSVDLPTFSLERPYEPTPDTDDTFYGPNGSYNTLEEYQRLKKLLEEAPTTLKEDELARQVSRKALSQLEMLLIEFRIERKRGLIAAMDKIRKELKGDGIEHLEL